MSTSPSDLKQRAHALVDSLPRNATWDDLARQVSARRDLEEEDPNEYAGRVAEEVLQEYELMRAEIAQASPEGKENWGRAEE